MPRIFIPVIGLVFLLQAVGAWPEKFRSENVPSHDKLVNEPEEDRDWIHHRIPDIPQHKYQPKTLVLEENPMNEPEEDRDMIHHGSSNIPQQDLMPRMTQPAEDLSHDHVSSTQLEHRLKMVLPPEPRNEPEGDRDIIHHNIPSHPQHQPHPLRVVLVEEPLNEPEEDRDEIHHGI